MLSKSELNVFNSVVCLPTDFTCLCFFKECQRFLFNCRPTGTGQPSHAQASVWALTQPLGVSFMQPNQTRLRAGLKPIGHISHSGVCAYISWRHFFTLPANQDLKNPIFPFLNLDHTIYFKKDLCNRQKVSFVSEFASLGLS